MPKLVAAAALPGALLAIAAVMAVATKIGNHLRQHVDPRLVASPASLTRSMNTLFTLLPLFLVVLHAGFLLVTAGRDFRSNTPWPWGSASCSWASATSSPRSR